MMNGETGYLISPIAATMLLGRIFLLLAMQCLYPGRRVDNTARIQRAIDYVASLTPNTSGFRGAVLLDRGEFSLSGELRISASGIVLRGMDREKTILLKKGVDRGALIYMEGNR